MTITKWTTNNQLIHRLDPRLKLASAVFFLILVVQYATLNTYPLLALFTLILLFLSRLSPILLIKRMKPFLGLILFTASFQLFFTSGTAVRFSFFVVNITDLGLQFAMVTVINFTLILFLLTIFAQTTNPLDFIVGLDQLLVFLRFFGIKTHDLILTLTLAANFLPIVAMEFQTLRKAQMSRGLAFDGGKILDKIGKLIPIFIPLLFRVLKRSNDLADALDVRGYKSGAGRTAYRVLKWKLIDTVFLLMLASLAFLMAVIG